MKMIPRLQAEESLQAVSEISVGTGSLRNPERQKLLNDWLRQANKQKERVKLPIESQKVILTSMGIGLECQKN